MKTKSKISARILRSAAAALLLSCAIVAFSSAIGLPNHPPKVPAPQNNPALGADGEESAATTIRKDRTLTFADRIAYQYAIEEVYWRHRIWPHSGWENAAPKPSLDEVMSPAQIQQKVKAYLRNSELLADHWQKPITPKQLQAEMERMANSTKQPDVLRELFAALGNDSTLIAECLARQVLADRLVGELYAHDEKLGRELKQQADSKVRRQRAEGNANTDHPNALARVDKGVLSGLHEDDSQHYTTAVLEQSNDRHNAATIAWLREPLQSWASGAGDEVRERTMATVAGYTLPQIVGSSTSCTPDSWATTSAAPDERSAHTAVWTGSEMIVWGGANGGSALNRGARYTPSTDSWVATSISGAPAARSGHTAVWTGSEMIVWGGGGGAFLNSGGRYNPSTDSWVATSTSGAPAGRHEHTVVWTGSEMIVWGGSDSFGYFPIGGRYNPITDSWVATSTSAAPGGRNGHTAVWTGSEMIVWGGYQFGSYFDTGGRYNPNTDSWVTISTSGAPAARSDHTAVWTGSEMIVWGGERNSSSILLNSGGRYSPSTDSWVLTSNTGVPAARYNHTAVWTGSEMIVWGGEAGSSLNSGGRYNPSTHSWVAISINGAPTARYGHTAVWTGTEMIVWGGNSNTGGRYNPITDSWVPTFTGGVPAARYNHTAVWTGSEMIVWGGGTGSNLNSGGRYNPSTDSWVAISLSGAPAARIYHTAVWTGSEMIVWGGVVNSTYSNSGGRYNPSTDSWVTTSTVDAPAARYYQTAVWTGSEMIVWGGLNTSDLNSGGRYNPNTDSWVATSTGGAPATRDNHTAVWTGSEMIVWGGGNGGSNLNSGGRYNPLTDSWIATSTTGAPSPRTAPAIWTGSEMIVWGGGNGGGRYNPSTDSWVATSTVGAPDERYGHTAVWTGSEMIVWGGHNGGILNIGGRYNPSTDSWFATSISGAPAAREFHTAVWTGSEMIVWGGFDGTSYLNTGGRYCGPTPHTTNLSTRLLVGIGNDVGIGGFIVTGSGPRHLLLRGIGPSLSGIITNALPDPVLELHGPSGFTTVSNDNWRDTQEAEIIATGRAPSNDLESAIVADLAPGTYTAILAGNARTTGVGLVEIYDLSTNQDSRLANISTRGNVGTGNDIMIGGFILNGGGGADAIILRGLGPSLSGTGVTVLADPKLELRNLQGALIASNDNWMDDPNQAAIISETGLAPTNNLESAIAATLMPGLYTALLSGVNSGTGVGLVEVYDLGAPAN